tara:strand:- start:615 stop:833 length:219 start_codon:yes stop_codon:yes gene_type:complete
LGNAARVISQFWELSNAGGSIKRLLRPVQLLLALHCVVENVHVNNEHRSEARLPVVRAGGGSLSRTGSDEKR